MKRNDTTMRQVSCRTSRMFSENGVWFFKTREERSVGPFRDELEASTQLEIYIRLVDSGMLPAAEALVLEGTGGKRVG